MRAMLCLLLVFGAGCADAPEAQTATQSAASAQVEEAVGRHNLTFGDQPLVGSQEFSGQFLPHENAFIELGTGIDLNGIHSHTLELPVARPVFVRVEVETNTDSLAVNLVAPAHAAYSRGGTGAIDEAHLMLRPGDEARVDVLHVLPGTQGTTEYELHVTWSAPASALHAGIPVEISLPAGGSVTWAAADGHGLNPVFVYEPAGDFFGRLDSESTVTFAAAEAGAYTFLQTGHGALASIHVRADGDVDFRLLEIMSQSTGRREVPALAAGEEFAWEDVLDAAPIRVMACTFSENFNREPVLRVKFPGGGSIDHDNNDFYLQGAGLCITTPTGDDRLYAGTYTTTYSNQGSGQTWVETTFTFLDR